MNALTIFTIIEQFYNSLKDFSLLNMFPFLVLKKDGTLGRFVQFKGTKSTEPFSLGHLILKDFVILTPMRYFINKIIFHQISEYLNTGNYIIYCSFLNSNKILVSLYNIKTLKIVKFKIKLFSFCVNLHLFDYFLLFFGKEEDKVRLKKEILENKIKDYQNLLDSKVDYDHKEAIKETKRMIKEMKKRYKDEIKNQKILDMNNLYQSLKDELDE